MIYIYILITITKSVYTSYNICSQESKGESISLSTCLKSPHQKRIQHLQVFTWTSTWVVWQIQKRGGPQKAQLHSGGAGAGCSARPFCATLVATSAVSTATGKAGANQGSIGGRFAGTAVDLLVVAVCQADVSTYIYIYFYRNDCLDRKSPAAYCGTVPCLSDMNMQRQATAQ